MSIRIRRIIDMVLRVLLFLHANPLDDPAWKTAVRRLEDSAARLQALVLKALSGVVEVGAAAITKEDLRAKLHDSLIFLARMAQLASREEPSMLVRFSLPNPHSSQQVYLNGCRVVLSEAQEQQSLLGTYGMTPEFLAQFSTTIGAYEQAIGAKDSGASTHIGANAEMRALASEIIRLVRVVDAIHRPLFRHDAGKRVAWKSARTVARTLPKADTEPATPPAPTEPSNDSSHPAA